MSTDTPEALPPLPEFASCPFCGKTETLVLDQDEETECWTVVCDASTGGPDGCGASCGYQETEAGAVTEWNRRAALAGQAAPAEPRPRILWRHIRTSGLYEVVCDALRESDREPLTVYRSVPIGATWARPTSEFRDGRFVREPHQEPSERTLQQLADLSQEVGPGYETAAVEPQPDPRIRDLSYLVARLSVALAKADLHHPLPGQARDYLRRHKLLSPLRET